MGLVGSLHCVGMCGPLNVLMISKSRSNAIFLFYHTGRIASYLLLGFLLGGIGLSFQLFHLQLVATFGFGFLLLVLYGIPGFRLKLEKWYYRSHISGKIQRMLAQNLSSRNKWFFSGVANGLLPCGLTYVAAAGAVVSGNMGEGMLFMLFFGLGTLPGLTLLSMGFTSSVWVRKLVPGAVPLIAVLSGGVLVLRGLLISYPNFNQLVAEKAAGLITVCGL